MTAQGEPAKRLRVLLSAFPERYALPGRPANAPPIVQDAHRQTQFLLGTELALFERAMNHQLHVVAANAKVRTAPAAALVALWSRVYSGLADTCQIMSLGSYVSCPPLLRTSLDCLAAEKSLIADGFAEFEQWLGRAFSLERSHAALSIELGRFRAGSVLAGDDRLGFLYRLLTEFSMPHFGATTLQVAPESGLSRLALTFGDQAFHLAWAELITGWLLQIAEAQVHTLALSGVFHFGDELRTEFELLARDLEEVAQSAGRRRCYVEEVDGRFLLHNFRRTPAAQPRRIEL
jgi:hypothetical protein